MSPVFTPFFTPPHVYFIGHRQNTKEGRPLPPYDLSTSYMNDPKLGNTAIFILRLCQNNMFIVSHTVYIIFWKSRLKWLWVPQCQKISFFCKAEDIGISNDNQWLHKVQFNVLNKLWQNQKPSSDLKKLKPTLPRQKIF